MYLQRTLPLHRSRHRHRRPKCLFLSGYEMQYLRVQVLIILKALKRALQMQRPVLFRISYLFFRKSGIWISFFCTVLDGTLVPNEEFIVGILNVGIFIPAEDEVLPVEAGLLTLNGDELLPPRPAGLDDASVRPVAITVMRA